METINKTPLSLWYNTPATKWTQALPLGNGRIGAMVHSHPTHETICLNEDTLWSGYPKNTNVTGAADYLSSAQDEIRKGNSKQAQQIVEEHMLGSYGQSYLPLGDLQLHFPHQEEISDYHRQLSLEDAVLRSQYQTDGVIYQRETFVSHPANALIMKFSASQANHISLRINLSSQLRSQIVVENNQLIRTGIAPSDAVPSYISDYPNPIYYSENPLHKGMEFAAIVTVQQQGGTILPDQDSLSIENATEVVITVCMRTSFAGFDRQPFTQGLPFIDLCLQDVAALAKQEYSALLSAHIADYQRFFQRTHLTLEGASNDHLPIPERLVALQNSGIDAGLISLYFQFGRYLLIASSREGTQAANLQGIWNHQMRPPWSSNYTTDINVEMNYWPAELCGLSELHQPLFDLIQRMRINGRETAKIHYNADGFTAHVNVDLWAMTSPVGGWEKGSAVYGFWPLSAGWLSRHLFERYEFTLDQSFLKEYAWPTIREAALFFLDVMVLDNDGYQSLFPATSPENTFYYQGERCCLTQNATMSSEIIRETLTNAISCCRILDTDSDFQARAEAALAQLRPLQVGSQGQLLEWDQEYEEAEPAHRHTSHLYPLHPGNSLSPTKTPPFAHAAAVTLERRTDEATGWALGWRINLYARLKNGNEAYRLLLKQLRPYGLEDLILLTGGGTYENLFDAHPPFQIDGNFGATAGIAEMFLYSYDYHIELLPALPDALSAGSISGLSARGGVTVDITFGQHNLLTATLSAKAQPEKEFKITWNNRTIHRTLQQGEKITLTAEDFDASLDNPS